LPADGTMVGVRETHLEARIVNRIRAWLASTITNPAAPSVDDQDFMRMQAEPWDTLVTVVDLSTRDAISHLVRLPVESPADLNPSTVFEWHDSRAREADELAYSFFERPFNEIVADRSMHLLHTGAYPDQDVEEAREYHRGLLDRDWAHPHPYGIDPKTITKWEIFEHRELLGEGTQEAS
jgi:hypothetical protein